MARKDAFRELAGYYDPIMEHVDYARWEHIAARLAEYLPAAFTHLDAGCGTGVLLAALGKRGWRSTGIDLSGGMLRAARKADRARHIAQADFRALPFGPRFDLVTCLFDSINFLTGDGDLELALAEFARTLRPGGILYFDVVTEEMVTQYFEGPEWSEEHAGFQTSWHTEYSRESQIAETTIRIGYSVHSVVRERVYAVEFIQSALANAGLQFLAHYDVENHRAPGPSTTRIDFIAAKPPTSIPSKAVGKLPKLLRWSR